MVKRLKFYLKISSNAAMLCLQLSTWKVKYVFLRITETLLLTVCFSRRENTSCFANTIPCIIAGVFLPEPEFFVAGAGGEKTGVCTALKSMNKIMKNNHVLAHKNKFSSYFKILLSHEDPMQKLRRWLQNSLVYINLTDLNKSFKTIPNCRKPP